MKVLAVPGEEDFDSLPPALRRKFFSNVERFRMRLAQTEHPPHNHGHIFRPNAPSTRFHDHLHWRPLRSWAPVVSKRPSSATTYGSNPSQSSRGDARPRSASRNKLRKLGVCPAAYLATQADSQYFHSLPAKIQQKQFSREEQLLYRQTYRESVIVDAADEAFYRWERDRQQTRLSLDSTSSSDNNDVVTVPSSRCPSVFSHAEPASPSPDSAVDMGDDPLHDSFRWLEEDGDLDLTLDDYHTHVAESKNRSARPRGSSFRRTFSLTSAHLARIGPASTSTASKGSGTVRPAPGSSPTPGGPLPRRFSIGPKHRNSISRPSGTAGRPQGHVPRASTSSIDPRAQYIQDPEARLKLRVYLASPQKFDEAIEFGFPAVENKENFRVTRVPHDPKAKSTVNHAFIGTFFDDADDLFSMIGEKNNAHDNSGHDRDGDTKTEVARPGGAMTSRPIVRALQESSRPNTPPVKKPTSRGDHRPQSWMLLSKTTPPAAAAAAPSQQYPSNREMTLKMTLTRPDLRTDTPPDTAAGDSAIPTDDPLRLADLPSLEADLDVWDAGCDEKGMMKKMWRKLRKRKN